MRCARLPPRTSFARAIAPHDDLRHRLALLASHMHWQYTEASESHPPSRKACTGGGIRHPVKARRLSEAEARQPKRCQAIKPEIRHLKNSDHGLDRSHLKGLRAEAMQAVPGAAGGNIQVAAAHDRQKGHGFLVAT